MKIMVINPNTTQAMTNSIEISAKAYARTNTEIIAVTVSSGPASIENYHDQYAAVFGIMEEVNRSREQGIDAYIIAAACDPGLYVIREMVDVPVIGIGEASMMMASLVAAKFSVVTVLPRIVPLIKNAVERSGLAGKCVSVRSINASVLDTEFNPIQTENELNKICQETIVQDGAEAICLGCSGMTRFAEELEKKLGVPIFDGVVAAVKLAESLVDMKKFNSKVLTFKNPTNKDYYGSVRNLEPKNFNNK